jgi:hypothetical protein
MPKLVVDGVRRAIRPERDLLKRQPGQQVRSLRELADEE